MNSKTPIYALNFTCFVHSSTLCIYWEPIDFSIELNNLDIKKIDEAFFSRIKKISEEKKITIDKEKFYLFVLGRRLTNLEDKDVSDVLSAIQSKTCFYVEDELIIKKK